MARFTFIDLFAGIGGFHQALRSVGGSCVGFSEIAADAINAYCANYHLPKERNFGDITRLRGLPGHDFMTAGVPKPTRKPDGSRLLWRRFSLRGDSGRFPSRKPVGYKVSRLISSSPTLVTDG